MHRSLLVRVLYLDKERGVIELYFQTKVNSILAQYYIILSCLWVGVGFVSKVVVTFIHGGGCFNMFKYRHRGCLNNPVFSNLEPYCPACRTTFIETRFRVAVICPIIPVPHCIRVFFYFVWFVFINHIFQFYYELCSYCNILDIYLS